MRWPIFGKPTLDPQAGGATTTPNGHRR
jgi:hypothetical protein